MGSPCGVGGWDIPSPPALLTCPCPALLTAFALALSPSAQEEDDEDEDDEDDEDDEGEEEVGGAAGARRRHGLTPAAIKGTSSGQNIDAKTFATRAEAERGALRLT